VTIETGGDPAERVHDVGRILEAINQGVREALLRHKQAGVPIATWRNGKVERIAPENIEIDGPHASSI